MLDGRVVAVCHSAAVRHAGGGAVALDLVHADICAYEHQDDECVVRHSLQ